MNLFLQKEEIQGIGLERFNPERFIERIGKSTSWIPFGVGKRSCLGMNLAYAEIKVSFILIALGEYLMCIPPIAMLICY